MAFWVATLAGRPAEFTLFVPLGVSLGIVGSLLTLRLPRNPIGWLLLAWGVIVSYYCFVSVWGAPAVARHDVSRWLQWAAVVMPVVWHPGVRPVRADDVRVPARAVPVPSLEGRGALALVFCATLAVLAALAP